MGALDLNYMALYAYICNPHLSRQKALERMGLSEKYEVSKTVLKNTDLEEIKYLYNIKGYTVQEISNKYNTSQTSIINFMNKNGMVRRGKGIKKINEGVIA